MLRLVCRSSLRLFSSVRPLSLHRASLLRLTSPPQPQVPEATPPSEKKRRVREIPPAITLVPSSSLSFSLSLPNKLNSLSLFLLFRLKRQRIVFESCWSNTTRSECSVCLVGRSLKTLSFRLQICGASTWSSVQRVQWTVLHHDLC